ncbi:hypothetical protein SCB12_004223 [Salmonella enterica]|uniref:Uncharacterized protein n=2 Tax=Salmonella enterica TaxID=28901 RepID=A0A6M3PNT5_SALTM|nr:MULTISPECIES: hypothetical protein [Salmonella]EEC6400639.1 hypothetical protein [Salmonella enterica subsp. enterica serovar 4,[5],12:i:-]EEF0985448.1 hypothetical protein [Salmonella enterica subsp. enterica serovar Heidelberg]EEO7008319.1 hypothetical protein [Salmonella enterica subsp. enterica serovar Newport]EHM5576684.1 hypothetical protein [Salmonella enterica subsp. enterica serovar Shubra]MBS2163720.1 hypothetical protein [Salmonella enterica subsp. enterica serovar 1,4,[5],12:i:-
MSIADTWSDETFIRLMNEMLSQHKEQEKGNDTSGFSKDTGVEQVKTSVSPDRGNVLAQVR